MKEILLIVFLVSFLMACESKRTIENNLQKECIQNLKNSTNPDFSPEFGGYLICDIDPYYISCPCKHLEKLNKKNN